MKNQVDFGTKLASFILVFAMLGNDLVASTRAIVNMDINHSSKPVDQGLNISSVKAIRSLKNKPDNTISKSSKIRKSAANYQRATPLSGSKAFLGNHNQDPLNLPQDDFFEFDVPENYDDYNYAILSYDVQGLKDGLSIPKAVNSYPAFQGLNIEKGEGWKSVKMVIAKGLIREGRNTIRFGMPEGFAQAVTVQNVDLVFSNTNVEGSYMKQVDRVEAQLDIFNVEDRLPSENLWLLQDFDMPSVPRDIRNVTKGGSGYSFRTLEKDSAKISIAYRTDLVPSSAVIGGLNLFYFDMSSKSWKTADGVDFDPVAGQVKGTAPSNTDYFAGLITTPEMPEASAFVPTAISDIKAANPSAGIDVIQPPQVSRTGEASVSYPIELPPGRAGMTPAVSINYSSDGGSGWLGVGWSVSTPQIAVDTKWGVPTFGGGETEGYTLNGTALYMKGGLRPNKSGMPSTRQTSNVYFIERTVNSYKKIKREGTTAKNYFWVETHADGSEYYYGSVNGTSMSNDHVLKDHDNNVIKWFLGKKKDRWGNYIRYYYDIDTETSSSDATQGGRYAVLSKIAYTGFGSSDIPRYVVEFRKTKGRDDATINLKGGIKELDYHVLTDIKVRYVDPNLSSPNDTVEISRYHFIYDEGNYGKQLLKKIQKFNKNNVKFYEHNFNYHDYGNTISYEPATTINANIGPFNNLFGDMDDIIKKVAGPVNSMYGPSSISTSTTTGWGAGGSVGVGICFATDAFNPNKAWTFSGRMGYSETTTKTRISLDDFSGDGLPDIVFDAGFSKSYIPLSQDDAGNQSFGSPRRITYSGSLNESRSSSLTYGVDFALPQNVLYYGLNWNRMRSSTYRYLTDYNADGFKDIVDQGIVFFGQPNGAGDYSFNISSENTPNPVIIGASASSYEDDEPLPDMQIVRTWEAPMDGMVNITGNAASEAETKDGMLLGVQYSGVHGQAPEIIPMTEISGTSGLNMGSPSEIQVSRGDKLLFRTQAKNDGYFDLAYWNPQVAYAGEISKIDANGIDYANSSYEDGFLLSGNDGVIASGTGVIKVKWPTLDNSVTLTDDVSFRIFVTKTNSSGTTSTILYKKVVSAGSPLSLSGSFLDGSSNPAPFVGSFAQIPGSSSGTEWSISFQVFSSSNIDWKKINWRPEVQFSDDPCGEPTRSEFPTVYYNTFNRVIKVPESYAVPVTGSSSDKMRFWPQVSMGGIMGSFTSDEISAEVTKGAWFVVKTPGGLLSKMYLEVNFDGTYNFYTDATTSQTVAYNSSSTIFSFSRGSVLDEKVFGGWYCSDKRLGEYLRSSTSAVKYYRLGSGAPVSEGTTTNFSVFAIDRTDIQDYHLGWGQFCWNDPSQPGALIGATEMEADRSMLTEDNDYTEDEPDMSDLETDITTESTTPLTQKFVTLIPRRGEKPARIPDYIRTTYANEDVEKLDCWSAWNGHYGSYSALGVTGPGKLGEPSYVAPPNVPANPGIYIAQGAAIDSKGKSLSDNKTAGVGPLSLGTSETFNNSSKYFTQPMTSFMDINGDSYPDIIKYDDDDPTMQLTSQRGGYTTPGTSFFSTDGTLGKNISEQSGFTVAGKFINQDKRFQKIGGGISGGANLGTNKSTSEWIDVNGDGLADRVSLVGGGLNVEYNKGNGLYAPTLITTNASLDALNSSTSTSISLGATVSGTNASKMTDLDAPKDKVGGSFSAGVGLNATGGDTKRQFIDLNGDGLLDLVSVSGNDVSLNINLGTQWDSPVTISSMDLGDNESLGIYGNVAGTIGFPAGVIFAAAIKVSLSGNGQANFAINKANVVLRDMNGDNLPDIVESDGFGKLSVRYATKNKGKNNLLKEVINPLGGSFVIDYHREGNKFGKYPVAIKTDTIQPNEAMVWDMPFSKWVLSQVTLKDGYDVVGSSSDLDGSDELKFYYRYDGGIKSRRDRDFIGFTRVQTYREPTTPIPVPYTQQQQIAKYTSEVTEYFRPLKNDPSEILKAEYLKGVPFFQYHLYHKEGWRIDPSGQTENVFEFNFTDIITRTKNSYEYFNVINDDSGTFGELEQEEEDFASVSLDALSEVQTIFPALTEKEEIKHPEYENQSLFHALIYSIEYDKYTNVTWYSRKGSNQVTGVSDVSLGVMDNSEYEYLEDETHHYSELYSFTYPFDNYTVDPNTNEVCYTLEADDFGHNSDYEDIYLCVPPYEFQAANSCTGPTGDNPKIKLVFRKLVEKISEPTVKQYDYTYFAPIIADMDYHLPGVAAGRTNVLSRHRIYIGSNNQAGFRRGTAAILRADKKAISQIKNELNFSGTQFALTDLTYDGYGNVLTIEGPPNVNQDRLTTTFTYETDLNQYVKNVTNDYGDQACFKYDHRTGNLLRQVDINGHATAYTYDANERLKDVYGPREYEWSGSAPTISFEYHFDGIGSDRDNDPFEETVPVAITTHNIGVGTDMKPNPPFDNCDSDDNFSSRPPIGSSNGLKTATFMDGLQRVIQVKKEVSSYLIATEIEGESMGGEGGEEEEFQSYNYVKKHEVSGLASYDYLGRTLNTTVSILESAVDIGNFNTSPSSHKAVKAEYDYVDRPVKAYHILETGGHAYKTIEYKWSDDQDNTFAAPHYMERSYFTNNKNEQRSYYNAEGFNDAVWQNPGQGGSVVTYFTYDALGQLLNTVDPIGLQATYTYDAQGRMLSEDHPDRGLTVLTYDKAGNLTNKVTPLTGSNGITMDYWYNRLTERVMADANTKKSYNLSYEWGEAGDGLNGAGRIVSVDQGSHLFLNENYAYDELGNRISEDKSFWVGKIGLRAYNFDFKYDSWGRMREITYADGEIVTYEYDDCGELEGVFSHHAISNPPDETVVEQIFYDGFGNIKRMDFGNGTESDFHYNVYTRRLIGSDLQTGPDFSTGAKQEILDKSYSYDIYGNLVNVKNDATEFNYGSIFGFNLGTLGGTYDVHYKYDQMNRLLGTNDAHISQFKTTDYELTMGYDKSGRILSKNQTFSGLSTYNLSYVPDDESHKYFSVIHQGSSHVYTYDNAGNIKTIDPGLDKEEFVFNELNYLQGSQNAGGSVHYMYDQNGERVLKGTIRNAVGGTNEGEVQGSLALDEYSLYVNPYYVVRNYNSTQEGTKHYYMGSQRVASAQMSYEITNHVLFPPETYDANDEECPALIADLENLLSNLADRNDQELEIDMEGLMQPALYEDAFPFEDYEMAVNENPCQTIECRCAESIYWTTQNGESCEASKIMYWYHPDYLGNTEFVTNKAGMPHQFFWYSPWGEVLRSHNKLFGQFRSRYKFNAKELDDETGNYYYGARYYNPQTSVWLSVDPLSGEAPGWTPYRFCYDNPVNIVDPTGMLEDDYGLDQNGRITLLRETDDATDKLILLDDKGNETNKSITVEHCSINNTYEEGSSYGVVVNNNEQDAEKVYKFMADNFDGAEGRKEIEVGKVTGTKDGVTTSIIHTAGNSEYTETARAALSLSKKGYIISTTSHSHPGGNEYAMPSGFYSNGAVRTPLADDAYSADWINTNINKGVKNYMYHPQSGKTMQYNNKRAW